MDDEARKQSRKPTRAQCSKRSISGSSPVATTVTATSGMHMMLL